MAISFIDLFNKPSLRFKVKVLVVLTMTLLLTACDPTKKKKPYNFINSVWVCKEIPACIAITEQEAYSYSYGEIKTDGKVVPITMVYMIANEGAFLDFNKAYSLDTIWTPNIEDDKYLWRGVVVYSRKEFTLETTDEERSYPLLSDDDLPLTFVRYDCTAEELLPLLPWDEEETLKDSFEPGQLLEFGLSVAEDNPKKDIWADIADFWAHLFN